MNIDLPTPNIPLLRKAVEWAEAEAAKGDQSLWRQDDYVQDTPCGTAYCIAGFAVSIQPNVEIRRHSRWFSMPVVNGREVLWRDAGQALLGITQDEAEELFYDWNSISDVRRIAEKIAARAGERL